MVSFSAWKTGLAYYLPPLLAAVFCLAFAVKGYRLAGAATVLFFIPGLFALFFFRDPPRAITAAENQIVSPADGTIVEITEIDQSPYYTGPCRRIAIFMSILSCHVNRAPTAGTVRDIQHKNGLHKNAMKPETTQTNEANTLWMDTPHGPITVRQIAGAVARRIICVAKPGAPLEAGQKFGMIKFGSRTELYLPKTTEIRVKIGQKTYAGSTILAQFQP